ncbi:MB21D1 [Mytilus edulis]|uniref:MB21D1 n=1 Tax=Mytilus edulis TaxID=6550 RepID=A0A8S3UMT3_MYTED|nr:MB21D1 [Mytilus edulis]
MKRSEERRYNNYDYPRCEGFKSPITIRDAQDNKGKHASATSNQATTETHDSITNNEQRQPFSPRHKVNTENQFENHEDGQKVTYEYTHQDVTNTSNMDIDDRIKQGIMQIQNPIGFTTRMATSTTEGYTNTDQINTSNMDKEDSILQGIMVVSFTFAIMSQKSFFKKIERQCSSSEGNHHDYRRARYQDQCGYRQCSSSEGNHHDYRRARYQDQYGYRQCYVQRDAESEEQATKHCPRTTDLPECYNVDTENLMSNLEDGYHGTPRPNKHDQYRNRRSYTSKDDESDEQATKHCPRTTDLPECYNEKRTDKCGKEKSPSTPLGKVKAQDQAPVSPISKERLIDHQDKCKLAMEEVSPAAKAINSFTNEFIKKLKEISTLNWSSFNIGSYYDKTKNCHPDEFDIMIYPNLSVEVNFDVIKIPGFYKVKLVSPRVQELEHVLDNDRYIIPGKFKNYAFEMFDRVLGTDGIRQGRRTKKMPKPGGCSPAYTVFYDAFPGKKPIDIDLVPCFNIDGWPPDKIARKINPSWIAIDDVVNRAMKYYDVVCKTCPEDATDKNLLFRLSFSRTEKMLIKHANSADKLNLKKNAFRFIKLCIQDLKDKHPGEIKKFCSYHIKQFMLTQYDTWPTREREGVRIQRYLIGELIKTLSLANPTIANYFITNDNVIRYVPSEEIAVIVKGLQEKDKLLH